MKQFKHSKNFWSLVGIGMPDYVEIRKELKKNYLRM
ncbi:MAG: YgjP-like metallopeptidase domain-containing protein [Patescibacteria group bacterium]